MAETNARIYCCSHPDSLKQCRSDSAELVKQLQRHCTSLIILCAWSAHFLPLLCLPPMEDITATLPVVDDNINSMLQYAIQDQIDPKAPQCTAEDWLNQSVYQLMKFSMRCWKARNAAVYGITRNRSNMI